MGGHCATGKQAIGKARNAPQFHHRPHLIWARIKTALGRFLRALPSLTSLAKHQPETFPFYIGSISALRKYLVAPGRKRIQAITTQTKE